MVSEGARPWGRGRSGVNIMGREIAGRQESRMEAVIWAVANLQGDNTESFCREMSACEVTG